MAASSTSSASDQENPFVEGVEKFQGDVYWWGGNLEGARDFPVRLSRPDKLVYSAHDYGPEIWPQPWFHAPDFPNNLPAVWQRHWAYLQLERRAPVLLGEFGGRSVSEDRAGKWQRTLIAYLQRTGTSYTYWSWNPNSSDTGGILQDNWTTPDDQKLRILSAYQWPLVGHRR